MNKKHTFNIGCRCVLILTIIIALSDLWLGYRDITQLPYSDFVRILARGKVASVTLAETIIQGAFKEPLGGKTLFADRV